MVKLSDELQSRKVIVLINGLPPAVRGFQEFTSDLPPHMVRGIKLGISILGWWGGDLGGRRGEVTILDFKTVEGIVFDEYAMENDR